MASREEDGSDAALGHKAAVCDAGTGTGVGDPPPKIYPAFAMDIEIDDYVRRHCLSKRMCWLQLMRSR